MYLADTIRGQHRKTIRREAREKGLEEGREEDLKQSVLDQEFQKLLLEEYGL